MRPRAFHPMPSREAEVELEGLPLNLLRIKHYFTITEEYFRHHDYKAPGASQGETMAALVTKLEEVASCIWPELEKKRGRRGVPLEGPSTLPIRAHLFRPIPLPPRRNDLNNRGLK